MKRNSVSTLIQSILALLYQLLLLLQISSPANFLNRACRGAGAAYPQHPDKSRPARRYASRPLNRAVVTATVQRRYRLTARQNRLCREGWALRLVGVTGDVTPAPFRSGKWARRQLDAVRPGNLTAPPSGDRRSCLSFVGSSAKFKYLYRTI